MKLPGHRPALPGNVVSFYIVPLDPAHSAWLAGHVPAIGYNFERWGKGDRNG